MVHRVDSPGSVSGEFVAGNPYADPPIASTQVPATWLNMLQDELLAVLEAVGITPSKANNAQLLAAINLLIAAGGGGGGGGLSLLQLGQLNSAVPLGSPLAGEGFRRLLTTNRVQLDGDFPGFDSPRTRTQEYDLKVAHGFLPRYALADGGSIFLRVTGRMRAETINPSLTLGIRHQAPGEATPTLFRCAGAFGTLGFNLSNASAGVARMQRFPKPTPWELELWIVSLGQHGKRAGAWVGPNSNDTGDGNTLMRGTLRFGQVWDGRADLVWGMSNATGSYWTSGLTYPKNARIVVGKGGIYIPSATHVAASTNEPGVGADFKRYWRTAEIVLNIRNAVLVDWTLDQEIQIGISSALVDDQDAPAAWSSSSVSYTESVSYVTHNAKRWLCMQSHTSDANKEPGVSVAGGPQDGERYWEESTGFDEQHVDTVEMYAFGTRAGFEPLF